jgi:hypothetical protein
MIAMDIGVTFTSIPAPPGQHVGVKILGDLSILLCGI